MDMIKLILTEMLFLEVLFLIFLIIIGSRKKGQKMKSEFKKVEMKKGPKRDLNESKKEVENKKILKKKTREFERFLILLIPLIIIGALIFSNYTGIEFNLLNVILLCVGILVVSVFIFLEKTRKYHN